MMRFEVKRANNGFILIDYKELQREYVYAHYHELMAHIHRLLNTWNVEFKRDGQNIQG